MSQVAGLGVTKARSVVTIGAFTAVYFVLIWCSGMLGFFGPAFMFVGGVVSLLLNGSVVMLMLVRSRMFGTLTIMGGVVGVLMVLTGHAWVTLPVAVVLGFLADLIARGGGYVSAPRNIAAYVLFSLWGIAPPVPDLLRPRPLLRRHCRVDGAGLRRHYARSVQPSRDRWVERHYVLRRVWRRSHRSLPSAQALR